MIPTRARPVLGLIALTVLTTASARAQSLTALRGLGYPIIATDARSEALGGLGIGLFGLAEPLTSPASAATVRRRGIVVSAAATERTSALGDVSASTGTTRFPLIKLLFPVGNVVLTGGYGSFLDQSWSVTREGTQELGTGAVGYEDILESRGGVGQARLGVAIPLGQRFAVGVNAGLFTGGQDLTIRRLFDTTAVGDLEAYSETRRFQYSGTSAQVGFRWDPASVLRLAGSLTWSGTLTADSIAGIVAGQEYDLPLQVAAGASAYLAPSVLFAVSGRWSGWSATDPSGGLLDADPAASSRDTWEVGAGIELDNPERRAARSFPLRLGFQYRQLPFTFVTEAPTEWLASAGIGMRIGVDPDTPLARIDLTVQRGARTAPGNAAVADLDETLWRFVAGISIFGT